MERKTYCGLVTLSTLNNMLIFFAGNINESLAHSTSNHWVSV
jgi:hypothetical protein